MSIIFIINFDLWKIKVGRIFCGWFAENQRGNDPVEKILTHFMPLVFFYTP